MEVYADTTYYTDTYGGTTLDTEGDAAKWLAQASRHIDTLTLNRIVVKGFGNLTEFQQEIIQDVCCRMAEFEYENDELLNSVMQSYSINGVSMSFGSAPNLVTVSGITLRSDIYRELVQTGLCCTILR